MYVLTEVPQEFLRLDAECRRLVELIVGKLNPVRQSVLVANDSDELQQGCQSGKCFLLKDGSIAYKRTGKFLYFLEAGDLLGYEEPCMQTPADFALEFAVVVDEYDRQELLGKISADEELRRFWDEYLGCRLSMYLLLVSGLVRNESETPPTIMHYAADEVIIEQGSIGEEVFTMVEGHADVYLDEVKVGEILADEIFGALAALTGTPRTAKVIATKRSIVLALKKANFIDLISNRPNTAVKLVEDMARTIVALNRAVVSYKSGKA